MMHKQIKDSFKAKLFLIKKEDGGRDSSIGSGYRPRLYIKEFSTDCAISLLNTDKLFPGEEQVVNIFLSHPENIEEVLGESIEFELKEGSWVVGKGTVLHIYD